VNALLPLLIDWFHTYGYPVLWLSVFVAAVGIPLPISLILLASGAFAALGDFDIILLAVVAITASTAGDNVGYLLGRKLGRKLLVWLKQQRRIQLFSPRTIQRSQDYFHRLGGWAILFSRFLVPALGGTVNLLAGAELYTYWHFVIYDAVGEAIGVAILLLLGYTFAASWEALGSIVAWVSTLCLGLCVVICLLLYLLRTLRFRRRATMTNPPTETRIKQLKPTESGSGL
jgi:membrane-associated protein